MFGLYRSSTELLLFGVCGGLAERLGIAPGLVRVFFAVLALASGLGVALYVLLALVLPLEGRGRGSFLDTLHNNAEELVATFPARRRSLGILLIAAGAIVLLLQLGFFDWLTFARIWPLLLIALGVALYWRHERE